MEANLYPAEPVATSQYLTGRHFPAERHLFIVVVVVVFLDFHVWAITLRLASGRHHGLEILWKKHDAISWLFRIIYHTLK